MKKKKSSYQKLMKIFIQEAFEHFDQRLKTFPVNWSQTNNLAVSPEEVSEANFIYYPVSQTSQKMHVNQIQTTEICSVTQCPKCKVIVDWSVETSNPKDVKHCL